MHESTIANLAERGFVVEPKSNVVTLDRANMERAVAEVMAGYRPDLWESYLDEAKRELEALLASGMELRRA